MDGDASTPARRDVRTPLPWRVVRLTRAGVHLLHGLAVLAVVFPLASPCTRQRLIRTWSGRLLRIFALEVRVAGHLADRRATGLVLVANHLSWLDIFVIDALQPACFIAKHDLKRWPVVGWLIRGVGTLFIDRSARRHLHEANEAVGRALARGDVVAIFPEGRIGDGRDVLPFHGSLLQPVVAQHARVQPVAIRYRTIDGRAASHAVWSPDVGFLGSVWRVTGLAASRVDLTLLDPLDGRGAHRRDLARAAEAAIREAVTASPGGSVPGKGGDPRAAWR